MSLNIGEIKVQLSAKAEGIAITLVDTEVEHTYTNETTGHVSFGRSNE
jgi:hypothetical protein